MNISPNQSQGGVLLSVNNSFRDYIGEEVSAFLKPGLSLLDYVGLTHSLNEGLKIDNCVVDYKFTGLLHQTDKDAWVQYITQIVRLTNMMMKVAGGAPFINITKMTTLILVLESILMKLKALKKRLFWRLKRSQIS